MKGNKLICLILTAAITIALSGCSDNKEKTEEGNAIYYWRTVFRLNQYEKNFLEEHKISKMYVKFFDVSEDWNGNIVPVGTTIFMDDVPDNIEIVPTIFITSEAIAGYPDFIDKMYQRIVDMSDANGVEFKEIQIDCDWTENTAEKYFSFMKGFKAKLDKEKIALSTTVRLFQLEYETPAADYGVLMCYNTGDIRSWETENSILDTKDIKPYMDKLSKFKMPLSVAFPCFEWDITYSEEKIMMGIEHDKLDLSDNKRYRKISENRYEILDSLDYYCWDPKFIRHEDVSIDKIIEAKSLVLENLPSAPLQFIMYHLDSVNLNKYTNDDVEKIYR